MTAAKNKVKSIGEVAKISAEAKKRGLKVVTTNGCFDLLHVGHVRNLEFAKSQGDVLVVAINSDAAVRKMKGKNRPLVPAKERAEVIASLACVDYVFVFSAISPIAWMKKIKPDVQVKNAGVQNDPRFLPERLVIEQNGGRVVVAPEIKGKSTTAIIKKILKSYRN